MKSLQLMTKERGGKDEGRSKVRSYIKQFYFVRTVIKHIRNLFTEM